MRSAICNANLLKFIIFHFYISTTMCLSYLTYDNSNMIANSNNRIISSNSKTNKIMCRKQQSILYLTFFSYKFVEIELTTFFGKIFVRIADTLSAAFLISSQTIFKSSRIIFEHLLLSQIHALGFQL